MTGGDIPTATVTVERLVDLALGTPEVGAANFNVLHSLLHVIIQQIDIQGCLVQFQGHDAQRLLDMMQISRPGPIVKLCEYQTNAQKPTPFKQDEENSAVQDKQSVDAGVSETHDAINNMKEKPGKSKVIDGKKKSTPETKEERSKWNKRVRNEKLRQVQEVTNMVKLNLKSCQCSSTYGSDGYTGSQAPAVPAHDGVEAVGERQDVMDVKVNSSPSDARVSSGGLGLYHGQGAGLQTVVVVQHCSDNSHSWRDSPVLAHDSLLKLEQKIITLQETFEALDKMASNKDMVERARSGKTNTPLGDMWQLHNLSKRMTAAEGGIEKMASFLEDIFRDEAELKEHLETIQDQIKESSYEKSAQFEDLVIGQKISWLKAAWESLSDSVHATRSQSLDMNKIQAELTAMTSTLPDASSVNQLQKCVDDVQRDMYSLMKTLGPAGIAGLVNGIDSIKKKIEDIEEDTENKPLAEKSLEVILEQLEFLKTTKADKQTMEEELKLKAEVKTVDREMKDDEVWFNKAVQKLMSGLDDTVARQNTQHACLLEAFEYICKELDKKLEQGQIESLKDFINCKLTAVQDRLKALAAMRKDIEAAGAKSNLLRNVNCLSCDTNVVMKRVNEQESTKCGLPPRRSMKPYITYELDQLRKLNRQYADRNLDDACCEEKKRRPKHDDVRFDHLCNRYCGGSHTITTPRQRVTKVGHYLTRYGSTRGELGLRSKTRPHTASAGAKMAGV